MSKTKKKASGKRKLPNKTMTLVVHGKQGDDFAYFMSQARAKLNDGPRVDGASGGGVVLALRAWSESLKEQAQALERLATVLTRDPIAQLEAEAGCGFVWIQNVTQEQVETCQRECPTVVAVEVKR